MSWPRRLLLRYLFPALLLHEPRPCLHRLSDHLSVRRAPPSHPAPKGRPDHRPARGVGEPAL
ncbi:APCDD1 isoform 2 [Pan troglodytes]|uniref:APC down-regulated 1 n=2 Tax=Homininae TaxID=207598 RepID=X6RH63_HUMAN|nr:APC down-regulated 1 [Homo sapiens]KAI4045577.1 APC down-regulated 1 [Homo sapiens]PNI16282.1 APCDD1 isoform 2 [Pan troglodytes]